MLRADKGALAFKVATRQNEVESSRQQDRHFEVQTLRSPYFAQFWLIVRRNFGMWTVKGRRFRGFVPVNMMVSRVPMRRRVVAVVMVRHEAVGLNDHQTGDHHPRSQPPHAPMLPPTAASGKLPPFPAKWLKGQTFHVCPLKPSP